MGIETIGQLKKAIADLPDHAQIYVGVGKYGCMPGFNAYDIDGDWYKITCFTFRSISLTNTFDPFHYLKPQPPDMGITISKDPPAV